MKRAYGMINHVSMDGNSWSNAKHPVAAAFAYGVPPPTSYEEYEFSGRLINGNRLIEIRIDNIF